MANFPEWYDGKHVNEIKFCEEFLREHPKYCIDCALSAREAKGRETRLLTNERD